MGNATAWLYIQVSEPQGVEVRGGGLLMSWLPTADADADLRCLDSVEMVILPRARDVGGFMVRRFPIIPTDASEFIPLPHESPRSV
jgi:hypothetical protein